MAAMAGATDGSLSGGTGAGAFAVEADPPGDPDGPYQNGGNPSKAGGVRPLKPAGAWQKLAAAAGKVLRPTPEPSIDLTFIFLAAVTYGVLFFSMGAAFLPGEPAWATLLLWVAAQIGSLIAWQLRLPRVIGMLCAGLAMRNIPWSATDAFPDKWGVQMRAGALATIFLRCGLELDFGTMRRFKYPAARLALVPGLVEAFYDGGLAVALFNMPVLLAFTMGFILKAVGPGLVVPAMFQLQKAGLGKDQGIPSTVVIAASFDDIVAITGYSIFSAVAITGQGNTAWQIASGPLQVIFGIAGGLLAGIILGCTRWFNSRYKRLVGLYGSALLLMYFLEYFNLLSGGALGSLFVGLAASNAWEKGMPRCGSLGKSFVYSPELERYLALYWQWVWEPMLFVTIGNSIDFSTLDQGVILRALIIILSGACLRILVTFLVMGGFGYTRKEKLFYAIAWTPKATVQAALSAAPLALIDEYKADSDDYEEWQKWGEEILVTGIFAIIVCGTLGVMGIHFAAPRLLEPAEQSKSESEGEEEEGEEAAAASQDAADQQQLQQQQPPPKPEAARHIGAGGGKLGGSATRLAGMLADGDAAAASLGMHHRRAASGAALGPELEAATLSDHQLLAEYLDAIRLLTAAVHDERKTKEDLVRLSDRVLECQKCLEAEMGRREPSVRELFRTASRLAQTFIVRQPPAGSVHAGGSGARRSQDFLAASTAPAAAKGSKGGGSEAVSRPRSPEDMA